MASHRLLLLCLLVSGLSLAGDPPAPLPHRSSDPASSALLPAGAGEPSRDSQVDTVAGLPSLEDLERRGATVGRIDIAVDDIFNEADSRENNWLYRLANDLHLKTKDSTVKSQVLLHPGAPFSVQQAEETARILRDKHYLYDAVVEPTAYDSDANVVDLRVRVRDVWSLTPGIGVGRSGGTNKTRARIVDENFLGRGQLLGVGYTSSVDRSGLSVDFRDNNFLRSWWHVDAGYTGSSDGSTTNATVVRPFFSLDTRWSAGISGVNRDSIESLYDLGEKTNEFRQQEDFYSVEGGWSRGLVNGWATRWLAGYRYDRSLFEEGFNDMPTVLVPEDRTLSYPWVGIELVEDDFRTTHNQDQIGRTEDVFLGKSLRLELGWAAGAFGADRSAGIFAVGGQLGDYVGKRGLVFFRTSWAGRLESGNATDALLSGEARYYLRFSEKHLFEARMQAAHGFDLDLDHQLLLGGDSGLRGYPLRYQTGDTRALLSVEERYYTDWFPFRLVRVGGAVFADGGRTWGTAPLATNPLGWLYDVGFGLRLGNARSALGNVLHIDLAFPLGAPADISSVQFLLEAQRSF